jgi:hypothetical protein
MKSVTTDDGLCRVVQAARSIKELLADGARVGLAVLLFRLLWLFRLACLLLGITTIGLVGIIARTLLARGLVSSVGPFPSQNV